MALWSLHNKPSYLSSADAANTASTSSGWVLTKNGQSEILVGIGNLTTKQIPKITKVTTDKSAYILGTDLTIVFTVTYNFPITTDITSTTTLAFSIGVNNLTAAYTSKTANTVVFTYTFPVLNSQLLALNAAGETVSSISVDDITLGSSKVITLNHANYTGGSAINANLTVPSELAIINSSITTPEDMVSE